MSRQVLRGSLAAPSEDTDDARDVFLSLAEAARHCQHLAGDRCRGERQVGRSTEGEGKRERRKTTAAPRSGAIRSTMEYARQAFGRKRVRDNGQGDITRLLEFLDERKGRGVNAGKAPTVFGLARGMAHLGSPSDVSTS